MLLQQMAMRPRDQLSMLGFNNAVGKNDPQRQDPTVIPPLEYTILGLGSIFREVPLHTPHVQFREDDQEVRPANPASVRASHAIHTSN